MRSRSAGLECGQFVVCRLGCRGRAGQQVQVYADDAVRVDAPEFARDGCAPVTTLDAVPLIAQPSHQLGECRGHPAVLPTGLGGRAGQREARDARQHQMERVGRIVAVGPRIGQPRRDPGELRERTRPAVRHQQRCRVRLGRPDVREMHRGAVDGGGELRPLVQLGLGGAPVVLMPPVRRELAEITQRYAVRPSNAGEFVRPAGTVEPLVQVVQFRLRKVDAERP